KTQWKPNYAVISYTDASFWDRVTEFAIPFDETIFANAKTRAETIMGAASASELEPGLIAGGFECRWCPFKETCAATANVRERPSALFHTGLDNREKAQNVY